jgi:two-component system chemotaxis response regulator CheY
MKKILVVDDSVTVRLYHKQILEGAGYEIDEAENGMEALEKSSEQITIFFW